MLLLVVGMSFACLSPAHTHGDNSKPDLLFANSGENLNSLVCAIVAPVNNNPGTCGANVTVPNPVSNDPSLVISTVTNDFNFSGNASGVYPVGLTTVTFSVTFTNGTMSMCFTEVMVNDIDPPTAVCTDLTFELDALGEVDVDPFDVGASSTDLCDPALDFSADPLSFFCNDTIPGKTITLTVTDDFGNTDTCVANATVVDVLTPGFSAPPNVTTQCSISDVPPYMNYAAFEADGGSFVDNCNNNPTTFDLVSEVSDGNTCPEVVTRVYQVSDVSSNTATAVHVVTINDTINPTITAPGDITIACEENPNDTIITGGPSMSDISDNCTSSAHLTVTWTDNTSVSNLCPQNLTITRTWQVMDECGNTGTDVQTISVVDTIGPDWVGAPPVIDDIDCNDPLPVHPEYLVTDNCSSVSIITMDTLPFIPTVCSGYTITYTWTAVDECGNTSTAAVPFDVLPDTEDPVIVSTPSALPDIACNDPFPSFETLDATDNCSNVTIQTNASYTVDVCGGYTVTYEWTPVDACGNIGSTVTTSFDVLPDTQAPTVTCADVTMSNDLNNCSALVYVPAPTFSDDCSAVSLSNSISGAGNSGFSYTFPVGTTDVIWTAQDDCGNSSTCLQQITVVDEEGPDLLCDGDLKVSLTNHGTAHIYASHIVLSASDNCGVISGTFIRRMDDACGIASDLNESAMITLCCADVQNTPMVIGSAYDDAGNKTECMVPVLVEDNIAPKIVEDLPDITVNCEFEIDLTDMSVFGKFVSNAADRDPIVIDGTTVGQDGLIDEGCDENLDIDETVNDNRDPNCNTGNIFRNFTVTDFSGNSTTGSQKITVIDDDPFDMSDITWPADVTIDDACVRTIPPPSQTGFPAVNQDNCSQVMISTADATFNDPFSGCAFFTRTFTVIDWCQYDPNANPLSGIWDSTQTITVLNDDPPIIQSPCRDTIICANEQTCLGDVVLTAFGLDSCTLDKDLVWTYTVDEFDDGQNKVSGSGDTYTGTHPFGKHRITWTLDDRCGNTSQCSFVFEVRDCKSPSAICLNFISINLTQMTDNEPMAVIWASDFDKNSTDNCTASENLKISFTKNVNVLSRTVNCSHLGLQPISMWVTDEAGNQSECKTFLDVQDNHGLCPDDLNSVTIIGNVATEDEQNMPGVHVDLSYGSEVRSYTTESEGMYAFTELEMYQNYSVIPEKVDNDYLRGVTTLDLVLIQRHVLGIEYLKTPYKIIAADANSSQSLTSIDLIELRKLILGIYETLPNAPSWRFVDENHDFEDPLNPWPHPGAMHMFQLDHDVSNMNFVGIKTGDVNCSMQFNIQSESSIEERSRGLILIQKQNPATGCIDVVVSENTEIYGLQMSFKGLEGQKINSVLPGLLRIEDTNFNTTNDLTHLSWNISESISLNKGDVLFSIKTDQPVDLEESERALDPEVYFDDLSIGRIAFSLDNDHQAGPELLRNYPNPFSTETTLEFTSGVDGEGYLRVLNASGQLVFSDLLRVQAGVNTYKISETQLSYQSGLVFYSLEVNGVSKSGSMLLIK